VKISTKTIKSYCRHRLATPDRPTTVCCHPIKFILLRPILRVDADRGLFYRAAVIYDERMNSSRLPDRSAPSPIQAGRFSWIACLLAVIVGPVVGLVWARVAEAAYLAPFLLFPILVGVFVGLTIVGLTRFAQIGHRPTILLAAVLAAATAVVGQHYLEYLSRYSLNSPTSALAHLTKDVPGIGEAMRRKASAENSIANCPPMAPSFAEYLLAQAKRGRPLPGGYVAAGWAAWLAWAIDALLTVAAAVAVAIPAVRVPYCNRCGTWYRTIRNGRIDVPTALRLAETCGVDAIPQLRSPRYRLSCCQGGCSPTRCELSWEEPSGAVALARVWLDGERRNQVATILDRFPADEEEE
jgi:hypothetical protein